MTMVWVTSIGLAISWALFLTTLWSFRRLARRLEPIERSWRELEAHLKERLLATAKLVDVLDQFAAHETQLIESLRLSIHAFIAARTIQQRIRATDCLTQLLAEAVERGRTNRTLASLGAYADLFTRIRSVESELQPPLRAFEGALADYNRHLSEMRFNSLARFMGFLPVEGFRTLARDDQRVAA